MMQTSTSERGISALGILLSLLIMGATASLTLPSYFSDKVMQAERDAAKDLRRILQAQEAFLAGTNGKTFGFAEELLGTSAGRFVPQTGNLLPGFDLKRGVLTRGGYHFALWLADASGEGILSGIPDATTSAQFFVAYAWPRTYGVSGRRLYAMTQRGSVYAAENSVQAFTGTEEIPPAGLLGKDLGPNPLADPPPWVHRIAWEVVRLPR